MKIAVDARTLGSCPSGIGIYLYDFIRALAAEKGTDGLDDVSLVLLTDVAESEQIQHLKAMGMPVVCFGRKVFRSASVYRYFGFIKQFLQREQPDLFWEPNNLIPVRLKGYHGRLVITVHDLFPLTKPEFFQWFYRLYFRSGIRKSIAQADAILFNSEETRRLSVGFFAQISKKKTFVSYLIVQKPPEKAVSDNGYFLYVGNLERRKGTDLLLKAYQEYCRKGGTRPLYLGGNIRDKEIETMLRVISEELRTVHNLGYLNEKRKYEILSRCHCFLFPSRAEGFGIPPLEALGYQKAVIVSDLSIFDEIMSVPTLKVSLKERESDQVSQLCRLMLADTFPQYSREECQVVLERYDSEILGHRLAQFFREIAACTE